MKKLFKSCFVLILVILFQGVHADAGDINLTVKENGNVVATVAVPLPSAGNTDINDIDGNPHTVDALSVLNVISLADNLNDSFNISNLIYYPSFSAFYLKCINVSSGDLCDLWQYKVNGVDGGVGMDQYILSGDESLTLFFGSETPPPDTSYNGGYHDGAVPPAPAPTPKEETTPVVMQIENIESPIVTTIMPAIEIDNVVTTPVIKKSKTSVKKIEIPEMSAKAVPDSEIPKENSAPAKKHWYVNIFKWLFRI
jgi:hypothetical protein